MNACFPKDLFQKQMWQLGLLAIVTPTHLQQRCHTASQAFSLNHSNSAVFLAKSRSVVLMSNPAQYLLRREAGGSSSGTAHKMNRLPDRCLLQDRTQERNPLETDHVEKDIG